METKTIHIPSPCQEDPSRMHEADKGLLCERCDKVVVDFTNWKNDDILAYLKARGAGKTCGMFHASQLRPEKRASRFLKPLRYAAFTLWGLFFARQEATAQETKPAPAPAEPNAPVSDSIVWVIRGEVKSEKDAAAIGNCKVTALNSDGVVVATALTGRDGRFELHLPAGNKNESFTLRYSASGYKVHEVENFTPSGRNIIGVTLTPVTQNKKPVKYATFGCPSF